MNKFTISQAEFLAIENENLQVEQDYKNDYPESTKLVNAHPSLKDHCEQNILVWVEDKPYMMTISEYNYWDEYLKLIHTNEYRCHFFPLVEIDS